MDNKEFNLGSYLTGGRAWFFPYQFPWRGRAVPFLPYSDINVKDTSLREALQLPLFAALREQDILMDEHSGGCVLFERRKSVEAILGSSGRDVMLF